MFNLCPCLLSTGTTKKSCSSSSLHLISPYQVFIKLGKIPPSHLFSTLSSPSSLRLSLYDSCSIPLIMFAGLQTFLKAWKNISWPWQLFPSLWRNSNFYCQCNCRGGVSVHVNWLTWGFFSTLLCPIISAYDDFICFHFWSELWALPIQDIGYPFQVSWWRESLTPVCFLSG